MKNISRMSDEELENSLEFNIGNERKTLHFILDHIREVARRELHLQRGFPDMKRYLMKRYGYTEPAARRRVEAANILRDVPVLAEKVEEGSICLTMIGELKRAIKEKENTSREKVTPALKTKLVAMIAGKSVEESQQQLAQALDIQVKDYEHQRVQRDESVRLELTVSKELHEKLQQCRDLSAQQLQQEHKNHTLASVIEVLADLYLKKKLGESSKSKSLESNAVNDVINTSDSLESKSDSSRNSSDTSKIKGTSSVKINKTLTPKTRREILARDKCCQFKDPKTGQVCGSTFILQTDHKTSQWAGGNHERQNLQILCANHNRFKYKQEAQLKWRT